MIPNSKFPDDGTYTISVQLCNFLGACGQASRTVNVVKSSDLVPSVTIPGQLQRTVSRSSALLLSPVAFTVDCNGTKSANMLSYAWSVSSGSVSLPLLQTESLDVSKFRLSPFRLNTLTYYDIMLTVTSAVSGRTASFSLNVFVQQAALVAQLSGGTQQSVAVGRNLTLDASGSSDPDMNGLTGAAAGLSFSWVCVQVSPTYSADSCPLKMTVLGGEKLALRAVSGAIGTTSRITVTAFDNTRSSSASVLVQVQDSSAPVVAITSSTRSVTAVNPSDRLALTASVSVQSSCTAVWSVDEPTVRLESAALNAYRTVIPTGTSRPVTLGLSSSVLPERATMQFTLSCGVSSSSITVTTNGPPLPGVFVVNPTSGVELSQIFTFSASLWSDGDLPLSYQFGFVTASNGLVLVAQGRSEASYATTTLAAGPSTVGYAVTCRGQIFDSLNAASKVSATVTVTPEVDQSKLQAAMLSQLSSSTGNNEAVKNAVAVAGAVINAVDCSSSPNCTTYHRNACGKVANTCGACLSGYVGEIGDSNSACVSTTAPKPVNGTGSTGSSCSSNSDCAGWNACNVTSLRCYRPVKDCPDKCSGHGSCSRVNTNSLKPVLDCRVGDPTCSAICKCDVAYSGANCASSVEEQEQRQALRVEFLQGLANVAATDDITSDSIAILCASLASLTQNSFELSETAIRLVTRIAASILNNVASVSSLSYEQASGVLLGIDAAAAASARLNSTTNFATTFEIMQTLAKFNELMSSQLVPGQKNVEYVQDNFRINSLKQLRGTNATMQIVAPSNALESSVGTEASSMTVETDDTVQNRLLSVADDANDKEYTEDEEFAITMITASASSYGSAGFSFNNNPVQVKVSRTSTNPTRVTFVLRHNAEVAFTSVEEAKGMVFNTTCVDAADRTVEEYECPLSGAVLTHECFGQAGVMTSYCPVLAPSCGILNPAKGVVDTASDLCEVVSFDLHSTVCSCSISPTTTERRLSGALAQSGVMDAVSVSVYVGNEFKNTFNSADDLTSAAALKRVLIVIIMFSTLWAGGLLVIFGCTWRRAALKKVHKKEGKQLERTVQYVQDKQSTNLAHKYLTDYVMETFPSVFSNKPFFSRLYGEVKRHHRYLTLLTAPETESGDKQRILTGIELLTVQTMLMFLLAVLYDTQGPSDDGTCQYYTDATECLNRKSIFDPSQTYCQWTETRNNEYICEYQDPRMTLKIVLYIAVIVSVLVSIISYPIDRIFELLSAPVADEQKLESQDTTLKRLGRRASNVARRASNFALSAAAAARAKITRATAIVGTVTRQLPSSTETAHALAAASMTTIAETSRRTIQARQMSQLRSFYNSGGKYGKPDGDSSSSSGGDSDDNSSSSDSDSEAGVSQSSQMRGAETLTDGSLAVSPKTKVSQTPTSQTLKRLMEEVQCQRRLLKPSEVEEFDLQWGLDPMGEFTQGDRKILPCFKGMAGAEELIMNELDFVKAETAKKTEKLNIASDAHTGLEIMHLFIKDLLGRDTPAAIIFETKSAEDFKHTTVVTRTAKRLAMALLVGINFFFVYYTMLTGLRKGYAWQRLYLIACIIQFIVEIVMFETMECVWVNCAIPVLVSDEVRRVGESLTEVIRNLCSNADPDSNIFLSAPDYLFVSTNVAKKFPMLMESILVQAYTTHLPGELARKWQVGSVARIQRFHRARRATLFGATVAVLQYLGTAPFVVQRLFIRFVQPFAFSALVLLLNVIMTDVIYIVVAVLVVLAGVAYGIYRHTIDRTVVHVKNVEAVNAEYQQHQHANININHTINNNNSNSSVVVARAIKRAQNRLLHRLSRLFEILSERYVDLSEQIEVVRVQYGVSAGATKPMNPWQEEFLKPLVEI